MRATMILMLFLFPSLLQAQAWYRPAYQAETTTSTCQCKSVTVYRLISPDWPQDSVFQNNAWEEFRNMYGLTDSDRLGNETFKYNCHAYVFYGSDRWLYGDMNGRGAYLGTTTGCWKEDPSSGTVVSSDVHSCRVLEGIGKCGAKFLCKNNQKIYGSYFPTTKYRKQ